MESPGSFVDLSNTEHVSEWNEICQKVADQVAIISFEEKIYDTDIKYWRVLIRWMDLAYTNPEGVVTNGQEIK